MLYLIGLGLSDEKDITVKGLEAVKGSSRIYLEAYTSILMVDKERLEAFYGKEVILAPREMVETDSDEILKDADKVDVSFLVVGDPFGATTHTDLLLRARALNIPSLVIHNASVMNAMGACGLQLYNFGQTVSLVFFTDTWKPSSFYDRVKENWERGMHTLILLDIKVREQSEENMARGRLIYEPPRYMSPALAISQLLETEATRGEGVLDPDTTLAITLSRLGTSTQLLRAGTLTQLSELPEEDFGPPLHSLVIVGKRVHPLEVEYAGEFAVGCEGGKEREGGKVGEGKRLGEWWRVARDVYGCELEGEG
ncbi:Diphthine synthase [Mrakia frigida]|uniref:diphthine synthase n=1 Tax=Mrakia frigida TaxID=29902 RepID=UPI003FCBEF61